MENMAEEKKASCEHRDSKWKKYPFLYSFLFSFAAVLVYWINSMQFNHAEN